MPAPTPFRKILIANRGEIALRVMRSARALGYRTVAVYSAADRHSLHVRAADQAVLLGDALPARSYLNQTALIDAARKTGADTVHPGYGFLAENDAFARACREAGLVFIGPSPEAIAAMGNKVVAKRLMEKSGVPCVPGYQGDDQSERRLAREAGRIGFPIMIKAAAGGGGRGMRLVADAQDFAALLQSAKSEAQSAFGDATVFLERAIVAGRHVEVQVFADRHGHVMHLGERDCSVQRRHQKIIEESPSPAVSDELRERMGAAAVAAARAVGYEGAGTVEFLLDAAGNFYFMEMNTRLQVEHPVTEAITGLDLVELQLRIAAGEPLPLAQQDVRRAGHAIEVRLCAEDAARGFMPQSGVMALWRPADGVRTDHALESGADIPPYYDSMIAKIISHGRTRDEARRKLLRALEDTVALGVVTNQSFLAACLRHPAFIAGTATAAFIGAHQDELLARDAELERKAAVAAAVLIYATGADPALRDAGRQLAHWLPISLPLAVGGRHRPLALTSLGDGRFAVADGERDGEVELIGLTGETAELRLDGVREKAVFHRSGTRLLLHYRGQPFDIEDRRYTRPEPSKGERGDGKLCAAMSGRVVAIQVAVGDSVVDGQPVLTLEAMKMEHIHAAPLAGKVSALHVRVGDQVAVNYLVAEIIKQAEAV